MKTSRQFLMLVTIGLLVVFLAVTPVFSAAKTLKIGSPWGAKTLDVQKQGFLWMRLGVVEGLTDVDQQLRLQPALAESWSVSKDKKVWTFHLRANVRFHDGTLLTSGIMKACLTRLMQKGALLKNVPIETIQAPDDKTLTITTRVPFAPLPAYLSKGEAAALAPSSFNAQGDVVQPVGTGFFKFESWKVKEEVVLSAYQHHWSGKIPKVGNVVCRCIPEALTRSAMLRSGELDIAQILPPDLAKSMAHDPACKLQSLPITRCRLLNFNLNKGPLSDIRVRQAVNYAINRQDLIDFVLEGFGQPAKTIFPELVFWSHHHAEGYDFNVETARQLLAEAGWKDGDGDGIRENAGKPLSLKLVTYPNRAELPPLAEVIQSQLSHVGVKVELVVVQVDAADQMRNRGDFDMFLVGRGLLFVPDPNEIFMTDYWAENSSKGGWGPFHYHNANVDELLLAARSEFNTDKRKAMYDRVQSLLLADAPSAYLNYYVNVDVLSSKVKGYQMHPNEQSFRLESVEVLE